MTFVILSAIVCLCCVVLSALLWCSFEADVVASGGCLVNQADPKPGGIAQKSTERL